MDNTKKTQKSKYLPILLWGIIGLLTLFIPYAIYQGEVIFTFRALSLLSEGTYQQPLLEFVFNALRLPVEISEVVYTVSLYVLYVFFVIFAFNFVFSLLLLIFNKEPIRKFARFISVFAGIAFTFIFIFSTYNIIGIIYNVATFGLNIIEYLLSNGGIFYLIQFIFSLILIKKQFIWFKSDNIPRQENKLLTPKQQFKGQLISLVILFLILSFTPFMIISGEVLFSYKVSPFIPSNEFAISAEQFVLQAISAFSMTKLDVSLGFCKTIGIISYICYFIFFATLIFEVVFYFLNWKRIKKENSRQIARNVRFFLMIIYGFLALVFTGNGLGAQNLFGMNFEGLKTTGAIYYYVIAFICYIKAINQLEKNKIYE